MVTGSVVFSSTCTSFNGFLQEKVLESFVPIQPAVVATFDAA